METYVLRIYRLSTLCSMGFIDANHSNCDVADCAYNMMTVENEKESAASSVRLRV